MKNNLMKTLIENEKGMALMIAIIILVATTIIGLGVVMTSNMASDVSGNLKVKTQTLHAAESCLYYQIRRIKDGGSTTTALSNYDLGGGLSCSATEPSTTGGILGGGDILDGFSMEEGSDSIAYVAYSFQVTANGPRNTQSVMDVIIRLPVAAGGG